MQYCGPPGACLAAPPAPPSFLSHFPSPSSLPPLNPAHIKDDVAAYLRHHLHKQVVALKLVLHKRVALRIPTQAAGAAGARGKVEGKGRRGISRSGCAAFRRTRGGLAGEGGGECLDCVPTRRRLASRATPWHTSPPQQHRPATCLSSHALCPASHPILTASLPHTTVYPTSCCHSPPIPATQLPASPHTVLHQ